MAGNKHRGPFPNKHCCGCKQPLPTSAFHRHRGTGDGLQTMCKDCKREHGRRRQAEHPERNRAACARYYLKHRDKELRRAAAYRAANPTAVKRASDNWKRHHPEANRAIKRAAYARAPEKHRASKRADYAKHREKRLNDNRAYRLRHREQVAARIRDYARRKPDVVRKAKRAWKSRNPGAVAADRAARRARELRATPLWAEQRAIQRMYELARQLSAETGIRHEVDHVVPLRGRHVSGLHVENNLRVVPADVNRRKSNRLLD